MFQAIVSAFTPFIPCSADFASTDFPRTSADRAVRHLPAPALLLACVALLAPAPGSAQDPHPGLEPFLERARVEYGLDADAVAELLAGAEFQQRVADLIARPAEAKPWYDYRPIFMTDQRLEEGLAFWRANEALIEEVSERYGVDPQVIVAIIGVETFYGRITGTFRVLDALTTLSFYYPRDRTRDRTAFFSKELLEYVKLGDEEQLPLPDVTGSYAGAMGMGQFMPSSYRAYAVDFDGDGRRDLWQSTPDVVGSVANYLAVHGWEAGGPVVRDVSLQPDADLALFERSNYKPTETVLSFHEQGIRSSADLEPDRPAALVRLEGKEDDLHWMTFNNFYVITRYNRSPMYAMVVYQLSEALRAGMETP
ncbi:MAG: lytic murein transglycosylase B [Xanthomonadales bacterium]|nr:lytic murein transglycosylase B [Xanthomonadales bacterium]